MRLARLLSAHPATTAPRAWALLALMLLHAARFPARVDSEGTLFLLREQDRGKWDARPSPRACAPSTGPSAGERVSAFHLEAGIAACHAAAPSWDATDWPQIVELYDELLALTRSPVVAVNRAIAVSRVEGALPGLAALEPSTTRTRSSATRCCPPCRRSCGARPATSSAPAACYRAALGLARSAPEHRWLASRLSLLV